MQSDTMNRWALVPAEGGGQELTLQVVPIPQPGPGQVRVKVHAAAINFRDLLVLDGRYGVAAAPELVPLSDGAGVVDAVGAGVESWQTGDRVISVYLRGWADGAPGPDMGLGLGSGTENGMLAEYAILAADRVTAAPRTLSLTEAATLPCSGLTAWTALRGNRPYSVRPLGVDDTVLVLGTGGVSLFAAQLARAAGAQVWVTTSDRSKHDRLVALGIAGVVDYTEVESWGEHVFAATGGARIVVNSAGGRSMDQSIAAVAFGGDVAYVGLFDFAGTPPDLLGLMVKAASIRGVAVGSSAAQDDLVATVDRLRVRPVIDGVVDFFDAPAAYSRHSSRESFGKVVIEMDAARTARA
ncbi:MULTISPECIES: zinc-dependent alcohol dehydrogenase family protein [Catenuloplanes]|uniref:NADPH:quinone reductase-like Zn-dependent oxidoreductase n=1 Tax=Catenuloplanes niger TaxID=587534 RepID=A0AAE4CPV8_9ACTN|nr:NAD(P)-dependent alcohol dehydrogenase [Catenuloplanes niger]MDR7319872.1 NADPH:quinone reductase-like Zn-dependent oxidoreductase [Catenuloplanes niger]